MELRIYEHSPNQDPKDITFNYNANFFLFATLELARPIAHGRVQTPAATGTPVLTGMPVSGMAYLDRPAEAGYFLFPDLSVRHEGLYRLSFNLYEETKEKKDEDDEVTGPKQACNGASFDWRMEVKSNPFSVYSAKKFPGLAESTTLSRTVAEQGCRVRIRRDVRMRRRDGKPAGDYKKVDDDYSHRPTGRTPERQMHPHPDYRQRSASAASDHSRVAYPVDPQRRPSMAEQYPSAPPPPPGYSQNTGGQHLGFGNAASRPQAYPGVPPPPMSPVAAYPASAHASPYPAPQPYGYSSRPSSQYDSRSGLDERRHSNAAYPPPSPYAPTNGDMKLETDSHRRMSQGHQPLPSVASMTSQSVPGSSSNKLPAIQSLLNHEKAPPSAFPKHENTAPIAVDLNPGPIVNPHAHVPTGSKRAFADSPFQERLNNGARPGDAGERNGFVGRDGIPVYDGLSVPNPEGGHKIIPENRYRW